MIKRTSLNFVNKNLQKNSHWKILDIGCGYTANKYANVLADSEDFSKFYKNKNFVLIRDKILPFKDKEFDFVIASHVIEHIRDVEFFIKELERISSQGYIEIPSRFSDNLVFDDSENHVWWFNFDDIKNCLIILKRNQFIKPFMTVSMSMSLRKIFRESFVLELSWQDKINYEFQHEIEFGEPQKFSLMKIVKKYLSKRIRMSFKK